MLKFEVAARSHVGLVRGNNEDSAYAGTHLLVVADGVGGAAAGEVASATAAYVTSTLAALHPAADPVALLADAVAQAAAQLRAGVADDPARQGLGTTLTAVLTDGIRVGLVQLGDSRAYRLRERVLTQLTSDHTLVQALVDAGRMSPEQARVSAHRHIVTRSLSAAETMPEPDLGPLDLLAGDRLLLCSDGLCDMVDDADLAVALAVADPEAAADALLAAALLAGGRDNVTCLVADVLDVPASPARGRMLGAAAELDPRVGPAAVR